jgi:sortase (surface protein transpeptidase)
VPQKLELHMHILVKSVIAILIVQFAITGIVVILVMQPTRISLLALPKGVATKSISVGEKQTSQQLTSVVENTQKQQESFAVNDGSGLHNTQQSIAVQPSKIPSSGMVIQESSNSPVSKIPLGFSDYRPPASEELPVLPGIIPQKLRIPSLGINANVEKVGLDNEGRMAVPQNIWNVAWFKLGPQPGERGNVAIAGHVDGPNSPAVFWDLKKIELGSRIYVQDAKGSQKIFEVLEKTVYTVETAPLDRIFGKSAYPNLNLITCAGTFIPERGDYDKRLVVYARLLSDTGN